MTDSNEVLAGRQLVDRCERLCATTYVERLLAEEADLIITLTVHSEDRGLRSIRSGLLSFP